MTQCEHPGIRSTTSCPVCWARIMRELDGYLDDCERIEAEYRHRGPVCDPLPREMAAKCD